MLLDLKNIYLLPVSIYYGISIVIFYLGITLLNNEKKPSFLSSLFLIIGHFFLIIIPTVFLLLFSFQEELHFKPQSIGANLTNAGFYLNSLALIVSFFGFYIFFHFVFFILNLDNMQDVSNIPANIRNKTCGWICPSGLYDTFYFSRGTYPIFEVMNFIISLCAIFVSLFLLYSSFSNFYPDNITEAVLVTIIRFIPIIVMLILTLWGKVTSLKETLHLLISDGYSGAISMNITNTGYYYSFFVILILLYLLSSNLSVSL